SATRLTPRAAEKLAKTDEGLAAYEGNISGGFEHPELYAAYADSAPFWSDYTLRKGPGGGAYYEDVDKYVAHGRRPEQARSMTLHELQHGVQTREGFAPGGHPESVKDLPGTRALADKYYEDMKDIVLLPEPQVRAMAEGRAAEEVYKRLAGEVEARNVQTRRNMTAAERRATPPWKTQDIPDEQQIITRVRPTRQEVFVPVKEEARIKKAQQLFDEYADEIGPDEANKRIHAETDDWFGPEGTLLYEIRDNPGMEIKGTFAPGKSYDLDEIIDHPELFTEYPELRKTKVRFLDSPPDPRADRYTGSDPATGELMIDQSFQGNDLRVQLAKLLQYKVNAKEHRINAAREGPNTKIADSNMAIENTRQAIADGIIDEASGNEYIRMLQGTLDEG